MKISHDTDFMTPSEKLDSIILKLASDDTPVSVYGTHGDMDEAPAYFEYEKDTATCSGGGGDSLIYTARLVGFILCEFPITREQAVNRLGEHVVLAWEDHAGELETESRL